MKCPECGGCGEDHPCSYASRNSEFGADCPVCNGTGEVDRTTDVDAITHDFRPGAYGPIEQRKDP